MGELLKQEINIFNKPLVVTWSYEFNLGVSHLSNGDPGYPPETEVEIKEVTDSEGKDMSNTLERMDNFIGMDVMQDLEDCLDIRKSESL